MAKKKGRKKLKKIKFAFALILVVIVALAITKIVSNGNSYMNNAVVQTVNTIKINKSSITLNKGEDSTLKATITPSSSKKITWTSSNTKVAKVDSNGKVTAVKAGNVIITAKAGNKTATCNVKVTNIMVHNQQNSAVTEYLKNTSNVKNIYDKYKCNNNKCYIPNKYNTKLTGNINIYSYNEKTQAKKLLVKTSAGNINDYLIPNNTYYLEMVSNKNKYEIVKVTGNLRMLSGLGNFRDLGGWNADGGKIKYGILYRSATTDSLSNLNIINRLGIGKVVDLRGKGESNTKAIIESIRTRISIEYYATDKNVRKAIETIMKGVVNEKKNVLFHCNFGRDRTGTIAYIIEGILGVSLNDRKTDYELTYFYSTARTRNDSSFNSLINKINKFNKNKYEQERFINWYLSTSTNKSNDLKLINNFRKKMIDGNPKQYKLSNNKLILS